MSTNTELDKRLYYCNGRHCNKSTDLKKRFSWNPEWVYKGEPYVKEFLYCDDCYMICGHYACKGCKECFPFDKMEVKYGKGFGEDNPPWEQLFCLDCIQSIAAAAVAVAAVAV